MRDIDDDIHAITGVLEKYFPQGKFKVCRGSRNGIAGVEVSWVNGPLVVDVDGAIDAVPERTNWVFFERSYSPQLILARATEIARDCKVPITINMNNMKLLEVFGASLYSLAVAKLSEENFYV